MSRMCLRFLDANRAGLERPTLTCEFLVRPPVGGGLPLVQSVVVWIWGLALEGGPPSTNS